MTTLINHFFQSYLGAFSNKTVFTDKTPKEMMASSIDAEGWFEWQLTKGTLQENDYKNWRNSLKSGFQKASLTGTRHTFFGL